MCPIVVPTLDRRVASIASSPADKIVHLLRFFFSNPGNVSEHFNTSQISFRHLKAMHESRPAALASACQAALQGGIDRLFEGTAAYTVDVAHVMQDAVHYRLTIEITGTNGLPALSCSFFSNNSSVDIDGRQITF